MNDYFHGTTKYKIIGLGLMFFVLMVIMGTVTRAQDNQSEETEIKPNLVLPYSPADKNYEAGKAGDKIYWPYPSWQIVSWSTRCMQTFPTLVPQIRMKLWPQEMFPFCAFIMDQLRHEWAYKDYIQNWNEGAPKSPALTSLASEYGDRCIAKVAQYREGAGYFPDPDGRVPTKPGMPEPDPT